MKYEQPLTKRQRELFAFMLKQKRKDNKLSQEKLGKKLGYCRSHIYKWENLKSAPDMYNVEDVATYFNLPMNIFIGDE